MGLTEKQKRDISKAMKLGKERDYGAAADELMGLYEEISYEEAAVRKQQPQTYNRLMQPLYNAAVAIVHDAERKGDGNNAEVKNLRTYMQIVKGNVTPRGKKSGLEKHLSGAASVVAIVAGMMFVSTNLTGRVIGGISGSNASALGAGLLILGAAAGFFWINSRN